MVVERSPNCAQYTDAISTLVELKASVPESGSACEVAESAFSCQTKAFEKPDAATAAFLKARASAALEAKGCKADAAVHSFSTNLVGARDTEYSAERLALGGLASNCYLVGNDPNQATHKIVAKCNPMYDMTNAEGERVRNFNMVFNSDLATCDVSDAAMPQLLEDARKVAALNAATNGYVVDAPEHLACNFSILPHI